jgi:DinB family protein
MDEDLLQRLNAAITGLESTRTAVDAGAPWPLAAVFDTSEEARWGPPEVLAHVAEMGRFWTGEIERILAGGPDPVPFGRVSTDTLRLGVIERDRSLPPRALYDRAIADLQLLARRWPELSEADRGRVGLHPRLGEMTVGTIADRFIVTHLAEHVEQLRAVTGTAGGSTSGG